jgi:hypothetical protein
MVDADYRNERINSSLKRIRAQYADLSNTLRDAAERIGLNTIVKQPGAGPVQLTDEPAQPQDDPQPAAPPPSSVSVRTSDQEEPPPPKPRKRLIDVDDLMRAAEAEMEERHETRPDQSDRS